MFAKKILWGGVKIILFSRIVGKFILYYTPTPCLRWAIEKKEWRYTVFS
jgi:hypothetical protein